MAHQPLRWDKAPKAQGETSCLGAQCAAHQQLWLVAATARYLFRGPGGWSMRETLERRRLHGRWAAATSAPFRTHGSGHAGRTGFDPWLLPPPGRTCGLLIPSHMGVPTFLLFFLRGITQESRGMAMRQTDR